ncbi:MAG: hypothetical protein K2N34_02360, partial [Lachnospiraceae bacterium]|nr:hypothetical protein [Lachnospiraceae bacterium]
YMGSYFCDEFFLRNDYDSLIELVQGINKNIHVTLVLPIFCEKNLKKGKELIDILMQKYIDVIDEVTVNDYGMLTYMRNNYNRKMNMGRLFFKDYRDPRYPEYFVDTWKPKGFHKRLKDNIERFGIHEVEIDITHKSVDLSENPGCVVGLHTPYTYMTTGKICEYASMYRPVQKKFRPNISCVRECLNAFIQYNLGDERTWVRVGRTVYFENNCFKLANSGEKSADTDARIIYFPMNEIMEITEQEIG